MDQGFPRQADDLDEEDGFAKSRSEEREEKERGFLSSSHREALQGIPVAPRVTATDGEEWNLLQNRSESHPDHAAAVLGCGMTIAEFVRCKFIPEHVFPMRASGRAHYYAILKHILSPAEMDCGFRDNQKLSRHKFANERDWPYLGALWLPDLAPEHVQNLIAASLRCGYSVQTATHIRNVVRAIISHAEKQRYFHGDNPASQAVLPEMVRREAQILTPGQCNALFDAMGYPEREMALFAILTSMNIAEICGLQWKNVNLTEATSNVTGESIPAMTIAVRKEWVRGHLYGVKEGRNKNIAIPRLLLPALFRLGRRRLYTGSEDFVLTSKAGTAINQINIAARRLKVVGFQMHMPWLSWRVLRRTHVALVREFGNQLQDHLLITHAEDPPRNYDRPGKHGTSIVSEPQENRIHVIVPKGLSRHPKRPT